jgi:hypothetical protein
MIGSEPLGRWPCTGLVGPLGDWLTWPPSDAYVLATPHLVRQSPGLESSGSERYSFQVGPLGRLALRLVACWAAPRSSPRGLVGQHQYVALRWTHAPGPPSPLPLAWASQACAERHDIGDSPRIGLAGMGSPRCNATSQRVSVGVWGQRRIGTEHHRRPDLHLWPQVLPLSIGGE